MVSAVLLLLSGPLRAQDRPFVFTLTTGDASSRAFVAHYDIGYGDRAFEVLSDEGRLEQRLGLQAALGRRWTLVARVGLAIDRRDARSTQQAELLYNVLDQRSHGLTIAAGGGMRHEPGGADVVLARIAAGRAFAASRLDGNLVFERPLAPGRDSVDLITTLGWSHRVSGLMALGIEAVGEDLEGFWTEDEAEGGAKVLVGPSVHVAPPGRKWQLTIGGGPLIHATRSAGGSEATRVLRARSPRNGFAVRTSFAYVF